MLQKILNFMGKSTPKQPIENQPPPEVRHAPVQPAARRNDATRPSYRIGKHKSSDIHKAIDLAG